MPLSDDQRAMLQLLLQRGQSYADIGSLLGLDVEAVRSRAREALTEIGGEDPDRDVSLTDYLLGQADPIGRADAARQLQADPKARDLAERLATQLRVLAPGSDLPELPSADSAPAKRKDAPAAPAPAADEPAPASTPRRSFGEIAPSLGRGQRQAIAGLIGAAILIVVLVLAVTGTFSGGGGGGGSSSSSSNSSSQKASNSGGPPRATLTAQDGSKAQGIAVIGRIRNVPALQVTAFNLTPTGNGKSYAVWLYKSNKVAVPLGRTKVSGNGRMQLRLPVPTQILQYIGSGALTDVAVSLTPDSAFKAEVNLATKQKRLPRFTGKDVLRGPIVGGGLKSSASGSGSSSQG